MIIGGILFYWRTAYLVVGLMVVLFTIPLFLFSRGIKIGQAEKIVAERKYRLIDALKAIKNKTIIFKMGIIS